MTPKIASSQSGSEYRFMVSGSMLSTDTFSINFLLTISESQGFILKDVWSIARNSEILSSGKLWFCAFQDWRFLALLDVDKTDYCLITQRFRVTEFMISRQTFSSKKTFSQSCVKFLSVCSFHFFGEKGNLITMYIQKFRFAACPSKTFRLIGTRLNASFETETVIGDGCDNVIASMTRNKLVPF